MRQFIFYIDVSSIQQEQQVVINDASIANLADEDNEMEEETEEDDEAEERGKFVGNWDVFI